jgi:hypothetical protein
MSGPYGKDHGVRTEIEDLEALRDQTQAHNVFGLSAGAVIAIRRGRVRPQSAGVVPAHLSGGGIPGSARVAARHAPPAAGPLW